MHCSIVLFFLLISVDLCRAAGKIVDFGTNLPEVIDAYQNKNWLIKFYAPWCHYCQQLELTYMNVAEKIYHKHDHLIVGRVDCTKYGSICEKYQVQSYPTVLFLTHNSSTTYRGDRSLDSLVHFAERLDGPDVKQINDCKHLKSLINQYGLILVSTMTDVTNVIHQQYEVVAKALKSTHWFFHMKHLCKSLVQTDNIYLLKKYLKKPIEFNHLLPTEKDLKNSLIQWITQNWFPVYTQISSVNLDRAMSTSELLVIAVLEEYKPAKKLIHSSREFNTLFEKFSIQASQKEQEVLFGWSTDLELIQSIVNTRLPTPNILILKSDFTYYYPVQQSETSDSQDKVNYQLPESLQLQSLDDLLKRAKENKLPLKGGNSYLHRLYRNIYSTFIKFQNMFHASPFLATVLIGLPSVILLIVVFTTCRKSEVILEPDDDEEYEAEDQQLLSNHVKQD